VGGLEQFVGLLEHVLVTLARVFRIHKPAPLVSD
jgi:hypothetical protein